MNVYERQLQQIDQLIRLDHLSRANAMLEQLADAGAPVADVRKRRIRIALAIGDHEQARTLCREALMTEEDDPEVWRHLAAADLALGSRTTPRAGPSTATWAWCRRPSRRLRHRGGHPGRRPGARR